MSSLPDRRRSDGLLDQAHGGAQAVRPVAAQSGVQMPLKTMHAAPEPNSASQSVSVLQNRQRSANSLTPLKSAQKPAFPVVSVQRQLGLLELHETAPPSQLLESAKQMPLL